jgi:Nucleotide-binding protein implicated in inhibition of septum formation
LTLLSGKTHSIISSISIYYNSKLVWTHTEKTKVKIRKLSKTQITNYLKKCGPKILSSVGCYQVEKNGPRIIENIKGDFFNVMGFPLFPFLKFLINEKK